MLNDDHRDILYLHDVIDQRNGLLSGRRVKIGERLVEEKNPHIVDQHAAERHALFLSAGELIRRMVQQLLHIYYIGHFRHTALHFILLHRIILECKSKVLADGEPDELAVRVLQHSADRLGHPENAFLCRIFAVNGERPGDGALVCLRNQCINTIRQRRFP